MIVNADLKDKFGLLKIERGVRRDRASMEYPASREL